MRKYGVTDEVTAGSLARHTQCVIQGAFILAKATGSAAVAAESIDHLRRYLTAFVSSAGKPPIRTAVGRETGAATTKQREGEPTMKIYWIRAQAPRRVLALLKHLRVDAELVEVDMMAGGFEDPAYVALNPNKKAPTLVDGDVVLWEFVGDHGLSLHQVQLGHVAGAQSRRAD